MGPSEAQQSPLGPSEIQQSPLWLSETQQSPLDHQKHSSHHWIIRNTAVSTGIIRNTAVTTGSSETQQSLLDHQKDSNLGSMRNTVATTEITCIRNRGIYLQECHGWMDTLYCAVTVDRLSPHSRSGILSPTVLEWKSTNATRSLDIFIVSAAEVKEPFLRNFVFWWHEERLT